MYNKDEDLSLEIIRDREISFGTEDYNIYLKKYSGYNSTCDEHSVYDYSLKLQNIIFSPIKLLHKPINEWMVGPQTDINIMDMYKTLIGLQKPIIRTDAVPIIAPITEISPEIKELSESNVLFHKVLTVALSEINLLLDKENYKIKIRIKEDIEFPQWKEIVIDIFIKLNYDSLIEFWTMIEEKVRNKIISIKAENKEDLENINKNIAIFIENCIDDL